VGEEYLKIRHRHLAGQEECDGASKEAEEEQSTTEGLEDAGDSHLGHQLDGPPCGGTPVGNAKSFIVPFSINMNDATMRSTLCMGGPQTDPFATTFGAIMMRPHYRLS
jgi:hypothetical protein